MVSSRQLSLLRNALVDDFEAIHEILNERKLKKIWGGLQGDKYIRFPKGFDPDREEAQYLWYRQFYLSQTFSRTEVVDKNFFEKRLEDLRVALPFLQWIRKAVGVYRKGSAR